jgi:hypothetical protein
MKIIYEHCLGLKKATEEEIHEERDAIMRVQKRYARLH